LAKEVVRELLDAGIHFGHRVSRWNPKMRPYIFGKRNMIHIIDIKETLKGLLRAKKFITRTVAEGGDVVFVGTKRQARNAVEEQARRANMHYVTERWLGGTLTNFQTVRSRLARLEQLERLEESGELANYSKKMISALQREKKKIKRNLEGIRRMDKLPGVLVAFDVGQEAIAVREAKKLGVPTICLIDTDGDPDVVDLPIPGNDDSMRGIEIIIRELADAALEGLAARPEEQVAPEQEAAGARPQRPIRPRPRRRPPQRVRAGQGPGEAPVAAPAAAEPTPAGPEPVAAEPASGEPQPVAAEPTTVEPAPAEPQPAEGAQETTETPPSTQAQQEQAQSDTAAPPQPADAGQ